MKEKITIQDIDKVGIELFRKNNNTFYKSDLSIVMKRLFLFNNLNLEDNEEEYYMKSGVIPGRIFYIYSDQLNKKNPNKTYDLVNFNGEICLFMYSKNILDNISKNPADTIYNIYDKLIRIFSNNVLNESLVLSFVMTVRLIYFIKEMYGVLDIEECRNDLYNLNLVRYHTKDSVDKFIDLTIKSVDDVKYFTERLYLEHCLVLKSILETEE